MKRHLPFILASVMCLPFCAFVVLCLVTLAIGFARLPAFLAGVFVSGFYWLSVWPVLMLPVLALASVSVVAAWFQKGKTRFELIFTGVYTAVMALHFGFAIWCFVTKPVFDL